MDAEAKAAASRIKHRVGLTVALVVEPAGAIERSLGKAKRVIDRRSRA